MVSFGIMATAETQEEEEQMDSPPNEAIVALEAELEAVESQLRRRNSGAAPSTNPQRAPDRQNLERRKKEIENKLVELRRENDKALGEDLVDEDLIDVANPLEPGS